VNQSRKKRSTMELGHDAFLDIVANLVGILIILVVVLGTQSTAVIEEIYEQVEQDSIAENKFASDEQLASLAQNSMRAASAYADSERFEYTIERYDSEIEGRQQQRAALLDLLSVAEEAWKEEKSKLDQQATLRAQRQSEYESTGAELAQLAGERDHLENQQENVVAVQHLPTPMAKTVFGDELHFRLKGNLLSLVPIEKLVEEIRRDFQRVAPSSRDGRMDAAVGPIRGYVARYMMEKNRELVARGGQTQMATRIQLVGLVVEPLNEPHGQSIDTVLTQSRELDIELAGRDPSSTTITVWVYPDSFAAFRQLKEHLYKRGFATAARPLPMGRAISGGPQGSRSNAQ
jgi:hypothetical protein